MKKQPEVTEKTRQKFEDAFWELAAEKPVSKIAVSEIARRAGYNRSTFYEYFTDTDEFLSYVETKLLEEARTIVRQIQPENESLPDLFRIFFTAMNEKIYILMGATGDPGFLTKVRSELIPFIAEYLPIPTDIPDFDYLVSFVNSAMFGLLQHWHEKGKNISVEEICALMQKLVLPGLQAYMSPV
ncbi:MAG: TetR/AcrR family transcriptional regulator [Clostridiales bacterium]|nr:TetR/AcrR family transcriptional regulator [Clostridiales bacterium]